MRLTLLLLLLLLAGCSPFAPNQQLPPTQTQIAHEAQLLWANPLNLPDAIRGIRITTAAGSAEQLCLMLNPFFIWEAGDGAPGSDADTFLSVQRSLRIEVDGVAQSALSVTQLPPVTFRRDSTGMVVGSHGADISACFNVADLPAGLLLGEASFQSTSGKAYGYAWAFRVAGASGARTVELPEALQDS